MSAVSPGALNRANAKHSNAAEVPDTPEKWLGSSWY